MKKIITICLILLFTNNYSLAEEKCSAYKKLSKNYLKCIGGKIKNKAPKFGLNTSNVKEKKYLTDWFKKK